MATEHLWQQVEELLAIADMQLAAAPWDDNVLRVRADKNIMGGIELAKRPCGIGGFDNGE